VPQAKRRGIASILETTWLRALIFACERLRDLLILPFIGTISLHTTILPSSAVSKMGSPTSASIHQGLLAALNGQDHLVAFPNKLLYLFEDAKPYNLDYPIVPAAVTYPKTPEQIAKIVGYASTANLKVQVRSGGHSYANYGISEPPFPNETNPPSQELEESAAPS
jgi:hypothetical protein